MKLAPINIKNKRATFDYELIDTYTAAYYCYPASLSKRNKLPIKSALIPMVNLR